MLTNAGKDDTNGQETNPCQILSAQTDEPVAHHTYQVAAPKFNPLNLAMMKQSWTSPVE